MLRSPVGISRTTTLAKGSLLAIVLASGILASLAADEPGARAKLSAAEVVKRNVAASGGLEAWRAVKTMTFSGKMGAGGNQRPTLAVPNPDGHKLPENLKIQRKTEEVRLPFLLEEKRPRKVRLELEFAGQTAVQVYDGATGWKLRPFLNRREVEPFTEEEAKASETQPDIDGLLVDYAAKGTTVGLDGIEKVEGRDNYKLKLTMKTGETVHVWIDAQTFLETKTEGVPRRLDGTYHPVEVYLRDYRTVSGLQIPFLLETRVLPVAQSQSVVGFKSPLSPPETITIEQVVVNPNLDDSLFSKQGIETAALAK